MEDAVISKPIKCSSCRSKEFIRENNEVYCKKCGLIVEDYNYE